MARRADYYRLLNAVTRAGDWEPWILFLIEGVEETARWTSERIRSILRLAEETRALVRAERPKIYTHELIEVTFAQPYCRIANLVEAGIAQRQTASVYLKELAALGVLEERRVGREKLFVNTGLMALLTADGKR
jgi:Fic family protein